MKWTRTPPTKPGNYWSRRIGTRAGSTGYISEWKIDQIALRPEVWFDREWAGPIEPPEEEK